jgi:hypothetical protein
MAKAGGRVSPEDRAAWEKFNEALQMPQWQVDALRRLLEHDLGEGNPVLFPQRPVGRGVRGKEALLIALDEHLVIYGHDQEG